MAKISFLGTGLIGGGLAEAAVGRGLDVTVWNRTREKAEALEKVIVADTPAGAVRGADRVHITMSYDNAVDVVLEACGDALKGLTVVDHTTSGPRPTAARSKRLNESGVRYLHAPVFMSPQMCREARGIMLAAGPREVFDEVKEALNEMTTKVDYLGERPDLAAAQKLFGNAMIVTVVAGLADVFAMATSLGIEAEDARKLFDTFNPGGVLQYRGKKMAAGDYDPAFELTMARKDVRLMIDAAGEAHPAHLMAAIAERMDSLIEQGHGEDDIGVMSVDSVPKRD